MTDEEDLYAISRSDLQASGTFGWQVRLTRGGRRLSKFFSDRRCGGAAAGLRAAKGFRDELVKQWPASGRPAAEGKLTRRNVSGVVGVSRVVVRTTTTRYTFWQATWSPKPGKRRRVKFSIRRYGEEGAFERACAARRSGERGQEAGS